MKIEYLVFLLTLLVFYLNFFSHMQQDFLSSYFFVSRLQHVINGKSPIRVCSPKKGHTGYFLAFLSSSIVGLTKFEVIFWIIYLFWTCVWCGFRQPQLTHFSLSVWFLTILFYFFSSLEKLIHHEIGIAF